MQTTTKKRKRIKKSIRNAVKFIAIGTIGAVLFVGMWIGSVIQTSERLSEMSAEVYRG